MYVFSNLKLKCGMINSLGPIFKRKRRIKKLVRVEIGLHASNIVYGIIHKADSESKLIRCINMVCIISVNISLFALICTVSILLDTAACVFFSVDSYGAKGDGVVDDTEVRY